MRTMTAFVCAVLVLGLSVCARSTVWPVPSPECPTIQAGIDSAAAGDTVLVADGTYTGAGNTGIDFLGKGILVTSENGPEVTIIDCEESGTGVRFQSGEDSTSVLRGFTIRNGNEIGGAGINCGGSSPRIELNIISGNHSDLGAGIYCSGSSPIIENNTIAVNTAEYEGGGIACYSGSSPRIAGNTMTSNVVPEGNGAAIYCEASSPTIIGNIITSGSAAGYGGAIYCDGSAPAIEGNTIIGNWSMISGGGIACLHESSPMIKSNSISENHADWGGAIYCRSSSPSIEDNAIAENEGWSVGGGIVCHDQSSPVISGNTITGNGSWGGGGIYCDLNAAPSVANCIIWGDSADIGQEIFLQSSSSISVRYSDVEGGSLGVYVVLGCTLYWDEGNIDEDPLFVTGPLGDYYLSQIAAGQGEDSPCVDAGDPVSLVPEGTTRTDGLPDEWPVDMGYHYPWNRRPDLVDQADTTIAENQHVTFTLEASDPDGDSIAFASPDLPGGATLDPVTGVFEWTPSYQQAGLYTVTFIATDFGIPALADTEQTDITVTDVVGVEDGDEEPGMVLTRYLAQNRPNPFRSATTIEYGLVAPTHVSLTIYDIRGAVVRRLVDEEVAAGQHRASWDGRDARGHRVGSGIYFCRLEAGDFTRTRRMVMLR